MAEELKKPLDSHTLYPQMMQATKLLILDYDVTRYHSFDLFRYLLLDEEMFRKCHAKYLPMIQSKDIGEQILFYMRNCPNVSPFDNFKHLKDTIQLQEFEDRLNAAFGDERMLASPTDVSSRLGIIFSKSNITGYRLKYAKDPYNPEFHDQVKTFTSDHVMDLRMAVEIIKKFGINAVMVSSIDLAVLLGAVLANHGWTSPITFIVGSYFYNYDMETGQLKHYREMNILEYSYKHEFGIFDPYTGLNSRRKDDEYAKGDPV